MEKEYNLYAIGILSIGIVIGLVSANLMDSMYIDRKLNETSQKGILLLSNGHYYNIIEVIPNDVIDVESLNRSIDMLNQSNSYH